MAQVNARHNEDIDSLLKRFKKAVEQAGILAEVRRREAYEKPGDKKRKKSVIARKRMAKLNRRAKPKNVDFIFNKDKTQKIITKRKPQRQYRGRRSNNE